MSSYLITDMECIYKLLHMYQLSSKDLYCSDNADCTMFLAGEGAGVLMEFKAQFCFSTETA